MLDAADPPTEPAVDRRSSPRWNIDRVQKCLQIFSVVAAAAWALWLYLSFEKDKNALEMEKTRLDLNQTKALASVERDGRLLGLRQQRVAYDQQQLTLKQQELAASIQREQLSYSLEEQRLRIQGQRAGLQLSEIDRQTRSLQLGALRQTPIEQAYTLSVERMRGRDNLYRVELTISITNRSQKEVNIFGAELYGYLGELPVSGGPNRVVAINFPSYRGPVEWSQHFQYPYVSIEASGREDGARDEFDRTVGGLAYGRLSTGETTRSSRSFFVFSDDPNRWFGYSLRLHTREQGRPDWQYNYDGVILLSESDTSPPTSTSTPTSR